MKKESKICPICSNEFVDYISNHRKYCCRKCFNKSKIGIKTWNTGTKGLMPVTWNKGKHLSEEHKKKLSLSHIGKIGYWKGKIKEPCSEETKRKISISNGGNGISDRTNKRYYHKLDNEYKKWRKKVFERDNYTCQMCHKRSSKNNKVYIEPHHIYGWSLYPKLRYEIKNGITLCKDCHRLIHK